MRKLISILFLFLLYSCSFSQMPPTPGTVGRSSSTVIPEDYNLSVRSTLLIPRFNDTTQANSNTKLDTCGRFIFTYNTNGLWVRVCSPKHWEKVAFGLIPAQFNPIQGFNMLLTGSYPNITFTADTTTNNLHLATQGFVSRNILGTGLQDVIINDPVLTQNNSILNTNHRLAIDSGNFIINGKLNASDTVFGVTNGGVSYLRVSNIDQRTYATQFSSYNLSTISSNTTQFNGGELGFGNNVLVKVDSYPFYMERDKPFFNSAIGFNITNDTAYVPAMGQDSSTYRIMNLQWRSRNNVDYDKFAVMGSGAIWTANAPYVATVDSLIGWKNGVLVSTLASQFSSGGGTHNIYNFDSTLASNRTVNMDHLNIYWPNPGQFMVGTSTPFTGKYFQKFIVNTDTGMYNMAIGPPISNYITGNQKLGYNVLNAVDSIYTGNYNNFDTYPIAGWYTQRTQYIMRDSLNLEDGWLNAGRKYINLTYGNRLTLVPSISDFVGGDQIFTVFENSSGLKREFQSGGNRWGNLYKFDAYSNHLSSVFFKSNTSADTIVHSGTIAGYTAYLIGSANDTVDTYIGFNAQPALNLGGPYVRKYIAMDMGSTSSAGKIDSLFLFLDRSGINGYHSYFHISGSMTIGNAYYTAGTEDLEVAHNIKLNGSHIYHYVNPTTLTALQAASPITLYIPEGNNGDTLSTKAYARLVGGGGGGGSVISVSGTTNRITSTGGTTPVIDISATFEALLGKVANPLSQFASTTSSQLAGVISDPTGSGFLVFATSPTLITPALGTPSSAVLTNATGTATGLTSGITLGLKSATTTVSVSAATAPTSGQVLTATSSTTATWQTITGTGTVTSVATNTGTGITGGTITTTGTLAIDTLLISTRSNVQRKIDSLAGLTFNLHIVKRSGYDSLAWSPNSTNFYIKPLKFTLPTGGTVTTNGAGTSDSTLEVDFTGLATLTGTETLTNKTIAAGSNTITGLTNTNLSGSAGITNANLANSTISGISLGSNLADLTINTTNLSLNSGTTYNGGTAKTINTIQGISTAATPQFAGLGIGGVSSNLLDIYISSVSALTYNSSKQLQNGGATNYTAWQGGGAISPGLLYGTVNPSASSNAYSWNFNSNTIVEPSSGTASVYATVLLNPASVTAGAGAVTNSATLYIPDAMTVSGSTNYALWIDAGATRIDGSIIAGGIAQIAVDTTTYKIMTVNPSTGDVRIQYWSNPGGGGGSSAFSALTTSTNTTATMTVGAGASLTFTSTGIVNASQINGVALGSTTATSGNILIASGSAWVTQTMSGDATINSSGVVTQTAYDNDMKGMQGMGSTLKAIALNYTTPMEANTTSPMSDAQARFVAIYLPKALTLTGVKLGMTTQGSYTADNTNSVALFSVSGGTLTKVAESTNNGNLWKAAANTVITEPFSSTYAAAAGLYYIGYLYNNSVQVTQPILAAKTQPINAFMATFDYTNSLGEVLFLASVSSWSSTYTASSLSATGSNPFAGVY